MSNATKLALGTVQFGTVYGVGNSHGQVPYDEILRILSLCRKEGIRLLDTSRCYGTSEEVLGKAITELGAHDSFDICTKLDLPSHAANLSKKELKEKIRTGIAESMKALNVERLPIYLLHTYEYMAYHGGLVWEELRGYQEKGFLGSLGISIAGGPDEALEALELAGLEYIQIPFNIFDTRWHDSGFLDESTKRGANVVNRSTYLQGLLLMDEQAAARRVPKSVPWINRLHALAGELGMDLKQLVFSYVLSEQRLSHTLTGVDTFAQIQENIRLCSVPLLEESVINHCRELFRGTPYELVNPALWPR